METKLFSMRGEEKSTIEVNDKIFSGEISQGCIYYAIRNELSNKRIGTASTKTRSEVRGSTAKPWIQKGTGRARAGSRKSPIWVGGGVAFGPKPRDYSYKMPKKMKRKALLSILSQKMGDEDITFVEDFDIPSGKTKDARMIFNNFMENERTILITGDDSQMLKRAIRNIPWVRQLNYSRLNAHDLFYARRLIIQESAANKLAELYVDKVEVR